NLNKKDPHLTRNDVQRVLDAIGEGDHILFFQIRTEGLEIVLSADPTQDVELSRPRPIPQSGAGGAAVESRTARPAVESAQRSNSAGPSSAKAPANVEGAKPVKAPMVGTIYR